MGTRTTTPRHPAKSLTARSAVFLCQILSSMKRNVFESPDFQAKVNDAAKRIMDYFGGEEPYQFHKNQMLDAQTQIIALMDLAKEKVIQDPNMEIPLMTDEIPLFLRYVRLYLDMLLPFVKLLDAAGYELTEKTEV